ncbi:hypothetical protein CLOM_g20929 [Closterium sp. NIES-68]|nr:hypothetical protein CLOM_g20929 [Closterium sp. NIES-68]GJP69013.1 hypothetical protein CLOP_g25645 [Closterium sp. NIES-67]
MTYVAQQARLVSLPTTTTSSTVGAAGSTSAVTCGSDPVSCWQRSPFSPRCSSARPLLATAPSSQSHHIHRLERADNLLRSSSSRRCQPPSRRSVARVRAAKDKAAGKSKGGSGKDVSDQELVKVVVHQSQEPKNLVSEQSTAFSFLERLPLPTESAAWWTAGGVAAGALAVIGVSAVLIRRARGEEERPVDSLARRGFIAADRSVPLRVIREFDDPTSVRNYRIGNATLVELEPLPPLTSEKMEYHRQQRRKEHGWKKPELVLVEGDPVPEGVDPMTVRFIPRRHPFSLNQGEGEEELSEEVARRRLMQRRGRPEKEQERSRRQLERLRREVEEKDRLEREERERNLLEGSVRPVASTGDTS